MAVRDKSGRFIGSGNPAGRPKGSGTSLGVTLRKRIAKEGPALVNVLIKEAKNGDIETARFLVSQILPRLKPEAAPAEVDLNGTPSEVGKTLLLAVGSGDMPIDVALEIARLTGTVPEPPDARAFPSGEALDQLYIDAQISAERERIKIQNRVAEMLAKQDGPEAAQAYLEREQATRRALSPRTKEFADE